jgi:hypothetical protein
MTLKINYDSINKKKFKNNDKIFDLIIHHTKN